MKKSYVKSLKEYDKLFLLDSKKILASMKKYKQPPEELTSVPLDAITVNKLKAVAKDQDIPYQVLMRVLILDGLERLKKNT